MSDYIPSEIQMEIMKKLPVKSLLQVRCVSKRWKSLIDSSEFITAYGVGLTHLHRLRVWYNDEERNFVLLDDVAFAQQEFAPSVFVTSKFFYGLSVVGSSQGLLCLYGYYRGPGHPRYNFGTKMAILWNLSIKKLVGIVVPNMRGWPYEIVLGFGVCPITRDPTIVKITNVNMFYKIESVASDPRPVEVFTLSSGSWRIPSNGLPNKSIQFGCKQVVIDRFIYWTAFDWIATGDAFCLKALIMSFDMTTHEFRRVNLPADCLIDELYGAFSISKLWESLVLLEYNMVEERS